MVLVDSDVWSEALRTKGRTSWQVDKLRELIEEDEVLMIGPIRQEVLSGIRDVETFEYIRNLLRAFPGRMIDDSIHELASSFFNTCRSKGIQGSHTDFLLCACSVAWEVPILSKDKDFRRYAEHVQIELEIPS